MKLISGVALAFLASLLVPLKANAQDATSALVGVWRVISNETKEIVSGKVVKPFGEQPTGIFTFSRGGRMTTMQFGTNRKAAAGPTATEAERAALFSSMTAYFGTYKVDGKKLIFSLESTSIQSWNDTQRTINFEINGAKFTGTSTPFKSLISGLDVVSEFTLEKIE